MKFQGMPEQFWVLLKPSAVVELSDILIPSTFVGLIDLVRGGLHEDEIAGIFADEAEAKQVAMRLLGKYPVRPHESAFFEILVKVMVQPKVAGLTAQELGEAALDAVGNAIRLAEEGGHRYRLADRAALGMSEVMELRSLVIAGG